MGRTEPTIVKRPAAFRRDARAKRARATVNKVIPAMLSAHPRAARGIERSELIVDPPALPYSSTSTSEKNQNESKGKNRDGGNVLKEKDKNKTKDQGVDDADTKAAGRGKKKKRDRQPREEQRLHEDAKKSPKTTDATSNSGHYHNRPPPTPRITLCVADALSAAHAFLNAPALPSHSHQRSGNENADEKDTNKSQNHHNSGKPNHKPKPTPSKKQRKVGILNMASPLAPGAGVLNGATGPEAALCLRTTLLPALRDEFYRLPELGVVYTPDVLVFRGAEHVTIDDEAEDALPKNDRWFVDVASAAMVRLPETEVVRSQSQRQTKTDAGDEDEGADADGCESEDEDEGGSESENENENQEKTSSTTKYKYAHPSDRALAELKMRAVLRVLASRGCEVVVLGAWGCGAHEGNPVAEIAAAWRRVLLGKEDHHHHHNNNTNSHNSKEKKSSDPEPWGAYISDIIFAIPERGVARAFTDGFGREVLLSSSSLHSRGRGWDEGVSEGGEDEDEEEEDPIQQAKVKELTSKIAELETQAAQVRSPHLKAGLENVLAGLRRQLPPDFRFGRGGDSVVGDEDDEDENENKDNNEVRDEDEDDTFSSHGDGSDSPRHYAA
ncbi:hypothetical protein F4808DRAFT_328581 [Astrocystis sublimbata]|nr:hypothetical protein F4808DRAFT_328581 [Astrocystis sublimbata]